MCAPEHTGAESRGEEAAQISRSVSLTLVRLPWLNSECVSVNVRFWWTSPCCVSAGSVRLWCGSQSAACLLTGDPTLLCTQQNTSTQTTGNPEHTHLCEQTLFKRTFVCLTLRLLILMISNSDWTVFFHHILVRTGSVDMLSQHI